MRVRVRVRGVCFPCRPWGHHTGRSMGDGGGVRGPGRKCCAAECHEGLMRVRRGGEVSYTMPQHHFTWHAE